MDTKNDSKVMDTKDEHKSKVNQFAKRTTQHYRDAVISIFKVLVYEFKQSDHEMNGLMNIHNKMANYGDIAYSDMIDRNFYRKLEDILQGKKSATKISDVDIFTLIEKFVWEYRPEKAEKLDILNSTINFGRIAGDFFGKKNNLYMTVSPKNDINTEKYKFSESNNHTNDLFLGDGTKERIYMFDSKNEKVKQDVIKNRELSNDDHNHIENIYLTVNPLSSKSTLPLILIFSDKNPTNFCYGIPIKNRNFIILRKYETGEPIFIKYKNDSSESKNEHSSFKFDSNMSFHSQGILNKSDTDYELLSNLNVIQFNRIYSVTKTENKAEAINQSNRLFTQLSKN